MPVRTRLLPRPSKPGRFLGLALLLVALTGSGCLWAPELGHVRREIETQVPGAHFSSQVKLSLGPMSLGLARRITGLIPPAAEANGYLQDVQHLQLAIFRTESLPSLEGLQMPASVRSLLETEGYRLVVKVRQPDEAVWVLEQEDADGVIHNLYVMALDRRRLVLVRVEGTMDRLFARAMENHAPDLFQVELN